jgi:PadR family transcriptional regulator PadR
MQNLEDPNYWKSLINIGLSKFFIIKILYEEPTHGYGILKKLTDATEGCCVPTFGSIYPILAKLTKEGYTKILKVSAKEQGRKKKIYALTPKGKKTYKIALEAWRTTLPYIRKAIDWEDTGKELKTISRLAG